LEIKRLLPLEMLENIYIQFLWKFLKDFVSYFSSGINLFSLSSLNFPLCSVIIYFMIFVIFTAFTFSTGTTILFWQKYWFQSKGWSRRLDQFWYSAKYSFYRWWFGEWLQYWKWKFSHSIWCSVFSSACINSRNVFWTSPHNTLFFVIKIWCKWCSLSVELVFVETKTGLIYQD
jgi:hypothetical protein